LENKEKAILCEICDSKKAFTHCLGCGLPMCENCACDQENTSGCGCACSLYFCPLCIDDPAVNPDAGPRKMDA
jgi:hypothetical protein